MIYSAPYVCFLAALFMYNSGYLEAITKSKSTNPIAGLSIATALYTGLFFELVAVLAAFILQDELIFYPSFFALPFFIWGAFSLKNSEIQRTLKYAILFLALTISFKWGIVFSGYTLFFAIAGIYYLAKIYYKLRFDVNYPTLAVHSGEAAS